MTENIQNMTKILQSLIPKYDPKKVKYDKKGFGKILENKQLFSQS